MTEPIGLRLGALLMPTHPWERTVRDAQRLDGLGFHHLWVFDHLSWRQYRDDPWHATYPWLAGLAAMTKRIRLGTMVANPNIRHPLLLAKDAMTIDHISEGRFTLGVGAGGTGFDATVLGQRALDSDERIRRLEEFAFVVDGLLRCDLHNHDGTYYSINEARLLPGCVQSPRLPLAIAGAGKRSIVLAVERADAWITVGDASPADLSEGAADRAALDQITELDEQCVALGRDPESIDRIFLVQGERAEQLTSVDAFSDLFGRYHEFGFSDIVFPRPRGVSNEIVDAIAAAHLAGPSADKTLPIESETA